MSVPSTESNFRRALARFEEFAARPIPDAAIETAIVKAFEYTFETAWKLARARGIAAGEEPKSPREALEWARRTGLITDEDEPIWVEMLRDRNRSAHIYIEAVAQMLVPRILSSHLPAARRLRDRLDAEADAAGQN